MNTSNSPLVSFVVPTRNGKETIQRCLSSILNQKSQIPFEVIVIDNGSSDGTSSLLNQDNLRVFREKKIGRSHARNRGLSEAHGEWIAFIDCDVILAVDWLEAMHRSIIANGLDGGQGKIIPEALEKSVFNQYRQALIKHQTHGTYSQLDTEHFFFPLINTAAGFYRKSHLLSVAGLDPSFETFEDADLAWRMWMRGSVFGVVSEAEAWVYRSQSGFLDYFWRARRMGSGLAKLYERWGINAPFSFSPQKSLATEYPFFIFIEYVRALLFCLGFELQKNTHPAPSTDFQQQRRVHFEYMLKIPVNEKSILCTYPGVRVLWTQKYLILKDCIRMKKVMIPRKNLSMDQQEFINLVSPELQRLQAEKLLMLMQN